MVRGGVVREGRISFVKRIGQSRVATCLNGWRFVETSWVEGQPQCSYTMRNIPGAVH